MDEAKQQEMKALETEFVRSSRMRRDDAQMYRLDLAFLAGLVHGTPGLPSARKGALCDRLWRLSSHLEDAIDGSAEREAEEWRARYHAEERLRGEDAAIGMAERARAEVLTQERDAARRELGEVLALLREANAKSSAVATSAAEEPQAAPWTAEDQALLDAAKASDDMPF